jgi:hypothetical protein
VIGGAKARRGSASFVAKKRDCVQFSECQRIQVLLLKDPLFGKGFLFGAQNRKLRIERFHLLSPTVWG